MTQLNIQICPEQVIGKISPYLTGACIEDVNHEVYGGIYSQMIFGESFEEEPGDIRSALSPAFEGLSGTISCLAEREYLKDRSEIRTWQPFRKGNAKGSFKATQLRARRGCRGQLVQFVEGEGEIGIENRGLNRWGMNFVAEKPYEGLLVASAGLPSGNSETPVEVIVALENADGSVVYAEQALSILPDGQWYPVSFNLVPSASDPAGRFSIKLRRPGSLWLDYVFLQPGPWGRFPTTVARKDIAEMLCAQGLTVLRYGGYMTNTDWDLESQAPGSGYRWKKMLGPRMDRPPYRGTFYRYNSNGFGILDFVQLCEAAGFLCIPVLNPHETIQDLVDFVEYVNGDVSTPWGARRAADGHSQPFGLRYIEIGNEEHDRVSKLIDTGYTARLRDILEALHAKDASLVPILGAGVWAEKNSRLQALPNISRIQAVVEAARGIKVLWDVHVGGDRLEDAPGAAEGLAYLRKLIDETDPHNQIGLCVLEENGFRHDIQRALGHARMILTFERTGLVEIDTAANCLQPWQQHDNYWDQGQVFFTPSKVWGMPPFYAQQMLAQHYRPLLVETRVEGNVVPAVPTEPLEIVAARSADGHSLVLKVVNGSAEACSAQISVLAENVPYTGLRSTCLSGDLNSCNSPDEPTRVVPVQADLPWNGKDVAYTFPAHSFTVLELIA
jgi:hypothetical protein